MGIGEKIGVLTLGGVVGMFWAPRVPLASRLASVRPSRPLAVGDAAAKSPEPAARPLNRACRVLGGTPLASSPCQNK